MRYKYSLYDRLSQIDSVVNFARGRTDVHVRLEKDIDYVPVTSFNGTPYGKFPGKITTILHIEVGGPAAEHTNTLLQLVCPDIYPDEIIYDEQD